jgi:hypothetical protein
VDDGEEACDYCSYAYEIGENGREGEKQGGEERLEGLRLIDFVV